MNRRAFALFLVAVTAISTLVADDRARFEEAQRRFDAGAYRLAIEQFQSLIDEYPGSTYATQAYLRIAQSHFYRGDYQQALPILQRSRVRARGAAALQSEITFWAGITRFHLERYEEAIDDLTEYLSIVAPESVATGSATPGSAAPESTARGSDEAGTARRGTDVVTTERSEPPRQEQVARARLYRGLSYRATERLDAARRDIAAAVDDLEGAERGYAAALLLQLYLRNDDDESVVTAYDRFSESGEIEPPYREAVVRAVADATYNLGRYDRARTLYRELTEYSVESAQWAYQRLYEIAAAAGDREEMDAVFRRAEQRLAGEPERLSAFWLSLGSEAVEAERYELAEFYLSRLWRVRDEREIPGSAARLLARAIEAQGRTSEALEIVRSSLDDPGVTKDDGPARYLEAARILMELRRPEEAVEVVEAYEGFQDNPRTVYAWSVATYRTGDIPAVIDRLEEPRIEAYSRDVPELLRLRGRAYLESGRPGEAVSIYRTYLSVREGVASVRLELVRALVAAEQFSAALQEIDRFERGDLTAAQRNELDYLRGLGLFHQQRYAQSLEAFGSVDDTAYEPALSYHIAWSLYRTGEIADAGRTMAAVRDALPAELYIDGSYLYAWTLYQRGRAAEAIETLLPLLGAGPVAAQEIDIRQLLGSAYLAEGRDEDALAQYRRIVERASGDDEARHWQRYASVLAALGRNDAAVAEYDEIARRFPNAETGGEALLEAGQILYTAERFAEARERFRRYRNEYRGGESYDRALYWGGRSSIALNEDERALLWWEPLIREYPRSAFTPQALFQSAEIHAENNRTREALELYDRYVAAYPNGGDVELARRRRQELRLAQSGLTETEAELWTELEPEAGNGPEPGSDRWFELVLELGRLAIREQITLTFQRNRIVPKLVEASEYSGRPGTVAHILLAEYYDRRGETQRAVSHYVDAAGTDGAPEELRAQSLYRLAELAAETGDDATVRDATQQLLERYPDSIWADQAQRFTGGEE